VPTSLTTVLERLFDDAGLFPPASMPMAEALQAHARARRSSYAPLVGPFLCPLARLEELDACVAGGVPRPAELSIVVHRGEPKWRKLPVRPGVVQVEAPLGVTLPPETLRVRRYLELPPTGEVDAAVEAVHRAGARAKVRCGGQTPDAVPSLERLAQVLVACADRKLPLKATAGLHHPFRRRSSLGVVEHGFVNLLAAASAAVAGADADHLVQILDTGESSGGGLLGRIDKHSRALLTSIGTCSLDEPVSELQALGAL
jgi:hypothetical protein